MTIESRAKPISGDFASARNLVSVDQDMLGITFDTRSGDICPVTLKWHVVPYSQSGDAVYAAFDHPVEGNANALKNKPYYTYSLSSCGRPYDGMNPPAYYVNGKKYGHSGGFYWESTGESKAFVDSVSFGTTADVIGEQSIRVYNRELTADEVRRNAALDAVRFGGADMKILAASVFLKSAGAWSAASTWTNVFGEACVPRAGDVIVFPQGAGESRNDIENLSVAGLQFEGSGTTIVGNSLKFEGPLCWLRTAM